MLIWIFAVLGLYFLQTLIAPFTQTYFSKGTLGERLWRGLGTRDTLPALDVTGERAHRALKNLQESLPYFLTFAVLAIVLEREDGLANLGARIFFVFRMLYLPTYVMGIPVIRSALWLGGFAGIVVMGVALVV